MKKNLAFGFSATARRFFAETVPCFFPHSCYRAYVSMGRQADKPPFMILPPQILRAHTFCVPGGRFAPLCTQKMAAVPALAVSKIAGGKPKPEV